MPHLTLLSLEKGRVPRQVAQKNPKKALVTHARQQLLELARLAQVRIKIRPRQRHPNLAGLRQQQAVAQV